MAVPEDTVKRRLIPQFSIRWLFAATVIVAVVFAIVGMAVRGSGWAVGVSFGMASLAILVLTHAIMFGLVWIFSVMFSARQKQPGRSPFDSRPAAIGTASPFAPADHESTSQAPGTVVEAVLVETPEDPPDPAIG